MQPWWCIMSIKVAGTRLLQAKHGAAQRKHGAPILATVNYVGKSFV